MKLGKKCVKSYGFLVLSQMYTLFSGLDIGRLGGLHIPDLRKGIKQTSRESVCILLRTSFSSSLLGNPRLQASRSNCLPLTFFLLELLLYRSLIANHKYHKYTSLFAKLHIPCIIVNHAQLWMKERLRFWARLCIPSSGFHFCLWDWRKTVKHVFSRVHWSEIISWAVKLRQKEIEGPFVGFQ